MIEKLLNRRSHRAFLETKIDTNDIDLIKKITLQAPTAGNLTLYSIIEVESQEIKDKLSVLCDNQKMISKAPHVWIFVADFHRWLKYFDYSNTAEKTNIPIRTPSLGDFHLAMQDTMIAAQTATVAIDQLGYGSCYVGDIIENFEQVQELLNLPNQVVPATMLIFGKPRKPLTEPRVRPDADSIFFTDTYKDQTKEEIEKTYEKHEESARKSKTLPFDNSGTIADQFFLRKYSSEFMKEMNRSTNVFLKKWCEKNNT